jgi:hypothetical protein
MERTRDARAAGTERGRRRAAIEAAIEEAYYAGYLVGLGYAFDAAQRLARLKRLAVADGRTWSVPER